MIWADSNKYDDFNDEPAYFYQTWNKTLIPYIQPQLASGNYTSYFPENNHQDNKRLHGLAPEFPKSFQSGYDDFFLARGEHACQSLDLQPRRQACENPCRRYAERRFQKSDLGWYRRKR